MKIIESAEDCKRIAVPLTLIQLINLKVVLLKAYGIEGIENDRDFTGLQDLYSKLICAEDDLFQDIISPKA